MGHGFSHDFSQERKFVFYLAIGEAITLILGVIMALFGWESLRWIVLIIAFMSLVAIGTLLVFLRGNYRSIDVVIRKNKLLAKLNVVQIDISGTQGAIRNALRDREKIDRERLSNINRSEARHRQSIKKLESKRHFERVDYGFNFFKSNY